MKRAPASLVAVLIIILTILGIIAYPARADLFGGDDVILGAILTQTIQQLDQMRQIFQAGSEQLGLLRDINRGINDSLRLLRTANPNSDPGIFRDWRRGTDSHRAVTDLYGDVVPSKDAQVQSSTDQSVAEAVSLNNSIYDYTHDIDTIGEEIKLDSHSVSPGGAQKLTAQSMGVMLHVMNTSLRAQATSLKLQAEVLALQNHKDKEASRETSEASSALKMSIENQTPKFETPRF
jgi:hypothetical protein